PACGLGLGNAGSPRNAGGAAFAAPSQRSISVTYISRQFHLADRSLGPPDPANFRLVERKLTPPGPNQILVKNLWLSVDPYMRGRMVDQPSYIAPFGLNEPLDGAAVGVVVESQDEAFAPGDMVSHFAGWRDRALIDA